MNREEIIKRVKDLNFAHEDYWILAGSAMAIYGLREQTHDIDMGCTTKLANELSQKYPTTINEDGTRKIVIGDDIEIFENWFEGQSIIIDDVSIITIEGLLAMKKQLNRDKDKRDVATIEEALHSKKLELWDACTQNFEKLENIALIRGNQVPQGMYHIVVDILVRHQDGSYLLMQRDYNKIKGGMWEASAGGSILRGETPIMGAKRELAEETGITSGEFLELGRENNSGHSGIVVNYLCTCDVPKDSITLEENETIAYKWVSGEEILKMSSEELASRRIFKFYDFQTGRKK